MKKRDKPRIRFGIGEWYGRLFAAVKVGERRELAQVQSLKAEKRPPLLCPFRSRIGYPILCSKEGGICSIRLYQQNAASGQVSVAEGAAGQLVTTCPHRFMQDGTVFRWVGETLLGTPAPLVVGEIGFLERSGTGGREKRRKDVGRIDNVLAHPDLTTLRWCALEKQAVYFSGRGMKKEFRKVRATRSEGLPFPTEHRRPDFRSSGAKRLMPQLQVKVPTLRRWGKKMAVVVDRSFFDALGEMRSVQDISSCDIAWFVVRYEQSNGTSLLVPDLVVLTTLEDTVQGLTGGLPVALPAFEEKIRQKIAERSLSSEAIPSHDR
jgi:hypothetical protein